jgi:glycosyltransferase involved in cell wall biosynthesis
MRIHLFSIPHTITAEKYSHCAFTGKVLKFVKMMSPHCQVFHYGIEGSEVECDKIDLMNQDEWNGLKKESLHFLFPDLAEHQIMQKLTDSREFIGDLANHGTPLYKEFNRRLKPILQQNYLTGDIICLPFGAAHCDALSPNMLYVESGIGYNHSFHDFRIFESYTWLHHQLGKEQKQGLFYWFVCPNYFDLSQWSLSLKPTATVGFLGRICTVKGCDTIRAIAERMKTVKFVLCGQGDPTKFLAPNIEYKPPIHGRERSDYLGSLSVLLAPSQFTEPFCGVAVEAQLCGTPVVCTDYGAMTETVEHLKTGVRCHTLQDFCSGIEYAKTLDRQYIRDRAASKYSLDVVAKQYLYILQTIIDVQLNGGWYAGKTNMTELQ